MELDKTFVTIGANTAPLAAGLTQAQGMVTKSAATMTKKLAGIGKGMTIAGALIVAGLGMAIKTAAKFEQSMANTASVAGATAEELKKLSDYARIMGEQSVYSASQAADGMYYLASAGMNTNEIMGALEGTLALAAATASDLAYTSESVAATLSQYGFAAEEAARVSNVFAAAISGSQATMEKLTDSMSYVGPMAKSMGISLETTTGILMNLYNAGLQGSKAGTALRMAFVKLIDPTEKGIAALGKLKVVITDSSGELRPFQDIINELSIAGMSAADAMDIFGIRAGPAMMALVSQGTGAIQEMTDKVTGTNKAFEMAEMQIDTFQGAMKLLKSAFEEFQITLAGGLMPVLKGMIEKISEGIKKVTAWMKENPKLTESIVKWTTAIGALMLVLGPLLKVLPGLVIAGGFFTTAVGAMAGAVGLAVINFILWYNIIKSIDEILHSHRTSVQDVTDAEDIFAKKQEEVAAKLGLTVEKYRELSKAGATVTEMLNEAAKKTVDWDAYNTGLAELNRLAESGEISAQGLYNAMRQLAIDTGVATEKVSDFGGEIGKIIITTEDLKLDMKLLTKEHEAYGESIEDSVKYYNGMINKLNAVDTVLQTELLLLKKGTTAYKEKQAEIFDNISALNKVQKAIEAVTQARKNLNDAMKTVKDRIYELTHTEDENALHSLANMDAVKAKRQELIDDIMGQNMGEQEEKDALSKVAEWYQLEIDEIKKALKAKFDAILITTKAVEDSAREEITAVNSITAAYQAELDIIKELEKAKTVEEEEQDIEPVIKPKKPLRQVLDEEGDVVGLTNVGLSAEQKEMGFVLGEIIDKQKTAIDQQSTIVSGEQEIIIGQKAIIDNQNTMAENQADASGKVIESIGEENLAVEESKANYKSWEEKVAAYIKSHVETISIATTNIIGKLQSEQGAVNSLAGAYSKLATAKTSAPDKEGMPTAEAVENDSSQPNSGKNSPDLPYVGAFAGGGYVPRTGLALVHQGETVTRQGEPQKIMTYSPKIEILVQGDGDESKIKRVVEDVLNDSSAEFIRRGYELSPGIY